MIKVQDTLQDMWDSVYDFLPELSLAVALLVGFALIAKLARRITTAAVGRVSSHQSVVNLAGRMVHLLTIAVGAIYALRVLELDGAVTSVLAGAGIIGLALGFAFQDIAANFISGVAIAVQKQFNVGDLVEVGESMGIIKKIELRTTTLQTLEGQMIYVPNKDVFMAKIVDYTRLGRRRVDINCGVSYAEDLDRAEKLALTAVKKVKGLVESQPIDLYYEEFGDSSINFVIRYWVNFKKQPDYLEAKSQGIKLIKKAFDDNDVTIPFPIQTIDFGGYKGGSTLRDQLGIKDKK